MDRKIIKNYLYNMMREVVIVILPLIAVPYISRVMTPDELGIYSYSMNIVTYFMLMAELGFQYLGRKEIAKAKNHTEKEEVFLKIFFIRLFFGVFVNIIYFFFVPSKMNLPSVYILQGINLVGGIFDISWYYVGIEDFKRITIRSIFYKVFNLFLLFTFVKGENVLLKYILCMALPNIFGNMLMFYRLGIKWRIPRLSIKEIKEYMRAALVLLVPTLLKSLYAIIDKTMLGEMSTMEQVGFYYQTFKVIDVLVVLVYSIGTVSFSRLVVNYHDKNYEHVQNLMREIVAFVMHIGIPIIIGLFCISDLFVPWFFGEQYLYLNILLPICAPIIIISALTNVFCSQYLIAVNKEQLLIKYVLFGVIINLLGDTLLIPELGALGAVVASLISESIVLVLSINYYKKTMRGKIFDKENIKCFISSTIMILVILVLKDIITGSYVLQISIAVVIGFLVYVLVELLLKDTWIIKMFSKVIRRSNG